MDARAATAVACPDEHRIELTEVCIAKNPLRASSSYLASARHAIEVLKR